MMTPDEFIQSFQNFKENADKLLVENPYEYSILRGPRIISSYFEDLLAIYIAENISNKKYRYFVDKSFFYKLNNKNKTCKPDILVCDNNKNALAYFDAKTDLGSHKSSFAAFIEEKNNFIEDIKCKYLTTKIESTKTIEKHEEISVRITEDIKYYIIVGGDWAHGNNYQKQYDDVLKTCKNVTLNILVHWTTKKNDNFKIRTDDFKQFNEFLEKVAKHSS